MRGTYRDSSVRSRGRRDMNSCTSVTQSGTSRLRSSRTKAAKKSKGFGPARSRRPREFPGCPRPMPRYSQSMPNGSAAAQTSLQLPRDLEPDFAEFKERLSERIASGSLTPDAFHLLARFGQLVYTQVAQLSLVARGDRTVLYTRHILDSLNPIDFQSPPPSSVLDVGSGGGFPGIPLAIVWPRTRFTILESREKKAGFLERVGRELGLRNVAV